MHAARECLRNQPLRQCVGTVDNDELSHKHLPERYRVQPVVTWRDATTGTRVQQVQVRRV